MTADAPKVRHRAPNVFDYSTLIEDAATFYVNNKLYEGWKNVRVTRTMDSISGSFSLTLLDKFTIDQTAWELTPGRRAHMHLGKNAVFEGYIDNMDVSFSANTKNVTLQGRDRTADLVDCSVTGESEYQALTLDQIATKLCEPFGVKVLNLTDVGNPFESISVKPSEKVFDLLTRLARQRGVILYSSTHGNLIINKRATTRAQTELVQGVNILEASANYTNTDRFSEYTVKAQNDGTIGSKSEDATEGEGTATDAGVGRFRPIVMISEAAGDSASAKSRAQWEATFRAAKSATIKVKVQGWREKTGELWDVNKLVFLDSPKIGIKDQLLISKVTFSQSESRARVCDLELVRKDSYEKVDVVSKDNDLFANLGL